MAGSDYCSTVDQNHDTDSGLKRDLKLWFDKFLAKALIANSKIRPRLKLARNAGMMNLHAQWSKRLFKLATHHRRLEQRLMTDQCSGLFAAPELAQFRITARMIQLCHPLTRSCF